MGRRTTILIGIALAVGFGTAPVAAWQDSPPSASESRNPLPPAIERPSGEDIPPPAPAPKSKSASKRKAAKKDAAKDANTWTSAPAPAGPNGPLPAGGFPDLYPPPPAEAPAAGKPDPSAAPVPALPAPMTEPAPIDAGVERVQTPGTGGGTAIDQGPLPPAVEKPGKPAAASSPPDEGDARFVPEPDRLPIGPQSVGLTVHVISPPAMNLNKPANLKILVKNTGPTEALGIVVRDVLPENLTYNSSQPEAARLESILTWKLGALPSGAERTIVVNVTPTKVGSFDHAATVTMMAGGRSTTMVREPKLKVEQSASPGDGKILKGQSVQFRIYVSNLGDGPARNVTVQAQLSPGLRPESVETNEQNLCEQTLDVVNPGERVELATLVADTILGGDQSCVVVVQSPDVVKGSPDAKSVKSVSVVEPKLSLTLSGSEKRYTGTSATYEIKLKNPGTAPARNIRVVSTLPTSARLPKLPSGARWDSQTRKLSWSRPVLDAGEEATLVFQVNLGGPGLYRFAAEARGDGALFEKNTLTTDVLAVADLRLEVSEARRVVDVGESTVLKILISNKGTKAATKIAVKAKLADTIEAIETGAIAGVDAKAVKGKPGTPEQGTCIFPLIDRLDPGKEILLQIKVQAVKAGTADCRVFLMHGDPTDDKLGDKLEDFAVFKVTDGRR